jgi:hypothetical protein
MCVKVRKKRKKDVYVPFLKKESIQIRLPKRKQAGMSFLPKKGKLAVVESFADLRMGERSLISGGLSGN